MKQSHAVRAEQLLKNGLRDPSGKFLPPLINAFGKYELGTTVYLNMLGILLFGKKIWVSRGITVILSLMGGIFTSLILKKIFKLQNYFVGLLFLSTIPLHFLHSRTAFTSVSATSFYAGFLYFYLLFREKNPKFLYPSIVLASLAVYTYPGIWLTIITSAFIFFWLTFLISFLTLNISFWDFFWD